MDEIQNFYQRLDNGEFEEIDQINPVLFEMSKIYLEANENSLLDICERERIAFAIQKSFAHTLNPEKGTINGLSYQSALNRVGEDGEVKLVFWPDVLKLEIVDFEYFEKRFKECKNRLAKIEFGLLVYFGKKTAYSKHRDFKKELFHEIFEQGKSYYEIIKTDFDFKTFFKYYDILKKALNLAHQENLVDEINIVADQIIETYKNDNLPTESSLRILLDFSGLMSDFFSVFKSRIDFKYILDENLKRAKEIEKTNIWGALYCMDLNLEISQKIKQPTTEYLYYRAELYVKLSDKEENNGNRACVSFCQEALRIYGILKDSKKMKEVEDKYSDLRGKFILGSFSEKLSPETAKKINEQIHNIISQGEISVLASLTNTDPWFGTLEDIQQQGKDSLKDYLFLSMFGNIILDKFGNKIDTFQTEQQKEEFSFWRTYGFHFQLGSQILQQLFIESFKAKKITYRSVMDHFEKTWFNDTISRYYHGRHVTVKPLDIVEPCIKRLFSEFDLYLTDSNYRPDLVTITDSMVLKVEAVLRYYCEKINIATFKNRVKGSDQLVMEKLLDDLLADIKDSDENLTGFVESDRLLIKFVLTEKAGLNLRNEVAHGLLDINEYTLSNIVVVLSILLKLSLYEFNSLPDVEK